MPALGRGSILLVFLLFSAAGGFQSSSESSARIHPLSRGLKMVRRSSPTPSDSDSSQFSISSAEKERAEANGREEIVVNLDPVFKIGVLADIQYAPIPDGHSFAGVLRYYRHSLEVARHAAQHFEQDGAEVVLNLGDIIDGKCQAIVENGGESLPEGSDPGLSAMEHVLEALSGYKLGPIIHTYGEFRWINFMASFF
jgi:hypothetical protein